MKVSTDAEQLYRPTHSLLVCLLVVVYLVCPVVLRLHG